MGEALNPAEAARYLAERHGLKVSVTTIRRWIHGAKLATVKTSRGSSGVSTDALDALFPQTETTVTDGAVRSQ